MIKFEQVLIYLPFEYLTYIRLYNFANLVIIKLDFQINSDRTIINENVTSRIKFDET